MLSWSGDAPASPGAAIPRAGVPRQPPHNTSMTDVFTLGWYLPPQYTQDALPDAYRKGFRKHQQPPGVI